MKLHRQAHVVYKTQYHIVWVTRYRRKILVRGLAEYFKKAIKEVREFHPDWYFEEVGVEADHVHLHMIIPPKYSVTKVVELLKSVMRKQASGQGNQQSRSSPNFLEKNIPIRLISARSGQKLKKQ